MSKVWKTISVLAITVIVLFGGFLYWTTWSWGAKEIEAVADQFKPDAGWEQITNQVIPSRTICLDEKCPSVHRSWKTGKIITQDRLKTLLADSGWNFEIQGDCLPSPNISGSGESVCRAEGSSNEYRVSVTVVGDYNDSSPARVVLFIDKNKGSR